MSYLYPDRVIDPLRTVRLWSVSHFSIVTGSPCWSNSHCRLRHSFGELTVETLDVLQAPSAGQDR